MIFTTAKLAIKIARSKRARKLARATVKFAKESIAVDASNRSVDVSVGGRTVTIDRTTFKRDSLSAAESQFDAPALTPQL